MTLADYWAEAMHSASSMTSGLKYIKVPTKYLVHNPEKNEPIVISLDDAEEFKSKHFDVQAERIQAIKKNSHTARARRIA